MKNLLKLALAVTVFLGIAASTASADPVKGQKIFIKKFKKPCGFNGAKFAVKHTQGEWKALMDEGKFADELMKICPNVKPDNKYLGDKYIKHIFDFSYEYASDSGNVPSC